MSSRNRNKCRKAVICVYLTYLITTVQNDSYYTSDAYLCAHETLSRDMYIPLRVVGNKRLLNLYPTTKREVKLTFYSWKI